MKTSTCNFSLLLIAFMAFCSSCDKNESLTSDNPKNVRLSKILRYSNSSASKLTRETVYTYDKNGNMIKEEFFSFNAKTKILERYDEFEYSGDKKTKMLLFSGVAGAPTLGSYIEYFYKNDLLVKEETRQGRGNYGSLIHSTNYEYDERGNLIRRYRNDPIYGISGDMKYTYDNQNRLILEENTATDPNEHKYTKHIYDQSGRKIKTEYTNKNEELTQYTVFSYNETSKLLEKELSFDKNGNQTYKLQHYYDRWGNLTETVINDECSMFKRTYNGKLLIEEIHYWWHEYGYHGTGQMPENGMSRYEYEKIK